MTKLTGKRILRGALLLAAMGLILALTLQKGADSAALSEGFRLRLIGLLQSLGAQETGAAMLWLSNPLHARKLGHSIEYFLLGVAAGAALDRAWQAGAFCCGFSLLDQTVKRYVPTKHFDAEDLLFDAGGYLLALLCCSAIRSIGKLKNKEPL